MATVTSDNSTYDEYKKLSLTQRSEIIKVCKCQKFFDKTQKKLVVSFGSGPEGRRCRELVLPKLSEIEGAVHRLGKAPRGYMERELGEWLGHLLS